MKRSTLLPLIVLVSLAALLGMAGLASASRNAAPAAPLAPLAGAPSVVSYQGQVTVSGSPYSGTGYFKFAIVDDSSVIQWSNDGVSPPANAVQLTVSNGLFNVLLGDTAIPGMSQPLTAVAFSGTARYLRVWFSSDNVNFIQLAPDRRIAAAPYALQAEEAKNADTLDGLHRTAFQQKYGNVVVVAQSGGDFTSVQAALTSITDASDTNRYLVWVGPGVYTETVTMKPYVDIEGAGELLTTISSGSATGTVTGANNAELRFLTVRNTGGASGAIAITNIYPSARFTHVTATASGGTNNYGVYNGGSPTMISLTATASGGTNSYGVYNVGSPTMISVTATASEGTNNHGVYNFNSSLTMNNVTAAASGGTNSYGVYNASGSPTMRSVTATASGGTNNHGVYNFSSWPTIQNSTVRTSGGTSSYGIYNSAGGGSYTVKVDNCQVSGSTNTIYNDTEFTVRIGASQLDGGPVTGGGVVTCIGVYDENYASPGYTTCP
jgi:hypothetical protein